MKRAKFSQKRKIQNFSVNISQTKNRGGNVLKGIIYYFQPLSWHQIKLCVITISIVDIRVLLSWAIFFGPPGICPLSLKIVTSRRNKNLSSCKNKLPFCMTRHRHAPKVIVVMHRKIHIPTHTKTSSTSSNVEKIHNILY